MRSPRSAHRHITSITMANMFHDEKLSFMYNQFVVGASHTKSSLPDAFESR